MTVISDRSAGFGLVASAGVRKGARALSQLAQSTGTDVELTQTNLRPQAGNLQRLSGRVGALAGALNGIEEARGVVRSSELSRTLRDASQRAVNRILQMEAFANSRTTPSPVGAGGAATVADALSRSVLEDENSAPIARLLAQRLQGSGGGRGGKLPVPNDIVVTAATLSAKRGDIFDRTLPTQVTTGGKVRLDIGRRALEAQTVEVALDPALPGDTLSSVRVVDAGRARAGNEGFVVKATLGNGGATVALDFSDPAGEDSRLTTAQVTGGDGSDVIFLSGANDSVIRAGAGNDYVVADGDAQIYGGTGDDILIGNMVFGEEGDDILFASTLANGGDGNDRITMFATGEEEERIALAFGGAGDDIIIGEVAINADGGEGNDAIVLRAGGYATGGAGNDTLTAFDQATLEGGEGRDDITLFAGGLADGGAGDDDITANYFSTVSGGTGSDLIRLNAGGVYRFARGDGDDRILLGSTFSGRFEDWGKANSIEMTGFERADVALSITQFEVAIQSLEPGKRDQVVITRTSPDERIDVVFTRDGFTQTLTIEGSTQTLGERRPIA